MLVPLVDLAAQEATIRDDVLAEIEAVAKAGTFILGSPVERFERWLAETCGVARAVGVASGTDALELGMRALGIGPGDAVVTSAFAFVAPAEAIVATGARPLFCDVDAETLCVSPRRWPTPSREVDSSGCRSRLSFRSTSSVRVRRCRSSATLRSARDWPWWRTRLKRSARATSAASSRVRRGTSDVSASFQRSHSERGATVARWSRMTRPLRVACAGCARTERALRTSTKRRDATAGSMPSRPLFSR